MSRGSLLIETCTRRWRASGYAGLGLAVMKCGGWEGAAECSSVPRPGSMRIS